MNDFQIDLHPFYDEPTQCRFFNGKEWKSGIVIYNFVIESVTGTVYKTDDCAAAAEQAGEEDWIWEYEWLPLKI